MSIRRKWQNLIHRKCPDCDTQFKEEDNYFKCKTEDCGFGLSASKMVEILTDQNHAAIRFMNRDEEGILYEALRGMGIENPEQFMRKRPTSSQQSVGPELPPIDHENML